MKKHVLLYLVMTFFFFGSCATKSYVRMENQRLYEEAEKADSTIVSKIEMNKDLQLQRQDSLYSKLQRDNDSLFLELMEESYRKNTRIDSLQSLLQYQSRYIDSLQADIDTLQRLETRFKDADYSIFDFSHIKTTLDSLMINQKHLSRELQYMIRDLNLIERNIMDIMNYSINSLKSQLQASNMMMKENLYKNNAKVHKMIMIYLMQNSSSRPEKLLTYIDSVYAMGDALDTVNVQYGAPSTEKQEDPIDDAGTEEEEDEESEENEEDTAAPADSLQ